MPAAAPFYSKWSNDHPATGSDHTVIQISICLPSNRRAVHSPNWKLTPLNVLTSCLKLLRLQPVPSPDQVSSWFNSSLKLITEPILASTPLKKLSKWSKAWWTSNISMLHQIFHSTSRAFRKGCSTPAKVKMAKYAFCKEIKIVETAHWNTFASSANTKELWALNKMKAPKDADRPPSFPNATTPPEVNTTLINSFFPPKEVASPPLPEKFVDAPPVSAMKVSNVFSKCSNNSAPGPDQILYLVGKSVHCINPLIIPSLLTLLLQYRVHPKALKAANGIVLPKPNKSTVILRLLSDETKYKTCNLCIYYFHVLDASA